MGPCSSCVSSAGVTPRTPGDGYVYFRPITLASCLDTLSNYGPGGEPCTAKAFSPRPGVLSGFVFNAVHRGTLPLANVGKPLPFFKSRCYTTWYTTWYTDEFRGMTVAVQNGLGLRWARLNIEVNSTRHPILNKVREVNSTRHLTSNFVRCV